MRHLTYFVSDVHLGLEVGNPALRERRFVKFLRDIPAEETESLYLLGDIWDFWYEYRDVVPKGYVQVFAALTDLIAAGVKVYFFEGNHDMWSFGYFEQLGMVRCAQPYPVTIGSRRFCLGHGDGLGPGMYGYKLMRWGFPGEPSAWLRAGRARRGFRAGTNIISGERMSRCGNGAANITRGTRRRRISLFSGITTAGLTRR